jgi:hypothetical protein
MAILYAGSDRPSQSRNPQLQVVNLAHASATCNNSDLWRGPLLDATQQIDKFDGYRQKVDLDPKTTLAAVFIGTNDLSFFVAQDQGRPANSDWLPRETTVQAIAGCVK